MQKTTVKRAVKKVQDPQVNANEKKINEIANEMATHFEERIAIGELIRWMATVNSDEKIDECAEIDELMSDMGWFFIPKLISNASKNGRIKFLKKGLPELFQSAGYRASKQALSDIGINHLTPFATLGTDPGLITEFMTVYTTFLCLVEMYGEYEYYSEVLREEKLSKAA